MNHSNNHSLNFNIQYFAVIQTQVTDMINRIELHIHVYSHIIYCFDSSTHSHTSLPHKRNINKHTTHRTAACHAYQKTYSHHFSLPPCRAPLHTLALECDCCAGRFVCPHHAAALCECGPKEWRLLFRFTLAQLYDKLAAAAAKVDMVSRPLWAVGWLFTFSLCFLPVVGCQVMG